MVIEWKKDSFISVDDIVFMDNAQGIVGIKGTGIVQVDAESYTRIQDALIYNFKSSMYDFTSRISETYHKSRPIKPIKLGRK